MPCNNVLFSATHAEGNYPTTYSNIYDLKNGEVYVYNFHNFEDVVKLNLKEELKKGKRIQKVSFLFPFITNAHRIFLNRSAKATLYNTTFKAACRRSGIMDLRFHDFRHTAATHMVTGGVDLVTVAEILGHTDIKMTMRYAYPTPENKRKAVEVLSAVFGGGGERIADGQREEGTGLVTTMSEN
ncbi:MAG: site-specific integrase [Candidatus Aminicenantes bacterium]|nr:site-specific integrase [Candidatus Aminicenantes bacterium]MBL7082672.1 site-specific integrase [Candidatus Aminicenantes bacterium]